MRPHRGAAFAAHRRALRRRERPEPRRHARLRRVGLRQLLARDSHVPAVRADCRHRAEAVAAAVEIGDAMKETNTMIRTRCSADKKLTYVDPWPSMIGTDGTPKPEFFVEDGLHMTPEGYKA